MTIRGVAARCGGRSCCACLKCSDCTCAARRRRRGTPRRARTRSGRRGCATSRTTGSPARPRRLGELPRDLGPVVGVLGQDLELGGDEDHGVSLDRYGGDMVSREPPTEFPELNHLLAELTDRVDRSWATTGSASICRARSRSVTRTWPATATSWCRSAVRPRPSRSRGYEPCMTSSRPATASGRHQKKDVGRTFFRLPHLDDARHRVGGAAVRRHDVLPFPRHPRHRRGAV